MPHRDPQTGQFTSSPSFEDIEVVTFDANRGVQAASLAGVTDFDGELNSFDGGDQAVIDYDEVVDRNEELVLIEASHHLTVYVNSTETADGFVVAAVEVSADPAISDTSRVGVEAGTTVRGNVVGTVATDDSIDTIGRTLEAGAGAPFSDGATGVGGAGAAGHDSWQGQVWPAEMGRFHPRDELFITGAFRSWNIDDAGIHLEVKGQHVYGVLA